MKKEEIKYEITNGLTSGLTHQEIFCQLKEKYHKDGKLLTNTLCKLPIPTRKKNLKFLWAILLALISILAALKALTILLAESTGLKIISLLHLIILIYIIYSAAKYEKYTFQFLGFLGILGILGIIAPIMTNHRAISIDEIVSIFLIGSVCICSYVLYNRLFVRHEIKKILVIAKDGRRSFEMRARFIER